MLCCQLDFQHWSVSKTWKQTDFMHALEHMERFKCTSGGKTPNNVKEILCPLTNESEIQCILKSLLCLAEVFRRKEAILFISRYRVKIKLISNTEKFTKKLQHTCYFACVVHLLFRELISLCEQKSIMASAAQVKLKQTACSFKLLLNSSEDGMELCCYPTFKTVFATVNVKINFVLGSIWMCQVIATLWTKFESVLLQ